MSGFIKKTLNLSLLRRAGGLLTPGSFKSQHAVRSLSSSKGTGVLLHHSDRFCNCNLCIRNIGTKGVLRSTADHQMKVSSQSEKELSDFLSTEIASEKNILKQKNIPAKIDNFQVELEEGRVRLTKQDGNELIKVSFQVSNTVDMEVEEDPVSKDGQEEIKSRPDFEVEIKGNNETLGFVCSIFPPESGQEVQQNEYDDNFAIDEFYIYKGNSKSPNCYSVSGDVIDGTLYDLLMNLLDEKGISNDFVDKVIDFSTAYEQSCYINLLEKLQNFVQKH